MSQFKLELRFGWPPTANHCYVTTKNGRRVLLKGAKQYMDDVEKRTRYEVNCTPAECWSYTTHDHQVKLFGKAAADQMFIPPEYLVVEATYYPPDNRRRDTDNVRKVLADGLAAGLGVDDSRFLWRDQDRMVDRIQPGVSLVVYPKEEAQ